MPKYRSGKSEKPSAVAGKEFRNRGIAVRSAGTVDSRASQIGPDVAARGRNSRVNVNPALKLGLLPGTELGLDGAPYSARKCRYTQPLAPIAGPGNV